ncbi:MAG: hypothetical protein JW839_04875, partial [Candidatus Lokiarchaeota archaeon]|nr:hypothetical protein [Candidatus Lokiarchaeota archaeon]
MEEKHRHRHGGSKVAFFLLIVVGVLTIFSGAPSEKVEGDPGESAIDLAETYHVSLYRVKASIEGIDVRFQVNITYNVTSGMKYGGFKRFTAPKNGFGKISVATIDVREDTGSELDSSYREFSGSDGRTYMEISFFHPGFTGVKTVSMNFLATGWLVEDLAANRLELLNIGTFMVSVLHSDYIIAFPGGFKPDGVTCSEGGTGALYMEAGRWVYLYSMDGTTTDLVFTYTPKSTNFAPLFLLLIALPAVAGTLVVRKAVKEKNAKAGSMAEIHALPEDLSLVELVGLKSAAENPRADKRVLVLQLVKAALVDLFSKQAIDVAGDGFVRNEGGEREAWLSDPFTAGVYQHVCSQTAEDLALLGEAPTASLASMFERAGSSFQKHLESLATSLVGKGLLVDMGGVARACAWTIFLVVSAGIASIVSGLAVGLTGGGYSGVAATVFISCILYSAIVGYRATLFKKYQLSAHGWEIVSSLPDRIQSIQAAVERATSAGSKDGGLPHALRENLPLLLLASIKDGSSSQFTYWLDMVVDSAGMAPSMIAPISLFVTNLGSITEPVLFPAPVSSSDGGLG